MRDREGFQEVDFAAFFGPIAKWAARIDSADRIPEYVARAYAMAVSGRPGPVVLALPEDMLGRDTSAKPRADREYQIGVLDAFDKLRTGAVAEVSGINLT